MKNCSDYERIHNLIDEELNDDEKSKLENHFSICSECRRIFDSVRQTRLLLTAQPPILPSRNFDREIQRLIENKTGKGEAKKGFLSIFAGFPLKLGFASLILAIALGVAFQLGRMSVSSLPQIILTQDLSAAKEPDSIAPPEKIIISKPTEKIVTQVKTVTKFIQVPVVKKIKEEKIIYVESKKRGNVETPFFSKQQNIAKNFNLKDLHPVSEISYRVVRNGENNE